MAADAELVLLFGALHLVGIAFGAMFLVMLLRSEPVPAWRPPDDEDDGGGGSGPGRGPGPEPGGGGGLPLPDARPARVRLRGHETLFDKLPHRERRPAREPEPVRRPTPARRVVVHGGARR